MNPLQGNLDFFLIRESRGPFRLKHITQVPSHIPISEGRLLLRCLWKMAYLFSQRLGIIPIPRWYGVHGTFLNLLYWNWWSSILETVVSGNLSSFLKGVKPLVLCDVDHRVVMEPMQGKLASSQFDFGTPSNFAFLGWHQCSSRLVTVLLGTLWS